MVSKNTLLGISNFLSLQKEVKMAEILNTVVKYQAKGRRLS